MEVREELRGWGREREGGSTRGGGGSKSGRVQEIGSELVTMSVSTGEGKREDESGKWKGSTPVLVKSVGDFPHGTSPCSLHGRTLVVLQSYQIRKLLLFLR